MSADTADLLPLDEPLDSVLTESPISPMAVLLADDDEDDRLLTADALIESRIINKFYCVADGEELMDFLYHRGKYTPPAESPRPGLLLLDLNMPKKDGREVLRDIKSDPQLRSVPVVILTTSQAEEDIDRLYELGANSYIAKPVSFEGLARVMRALTQYWFQIVKLPQGK
jgi:CheY-like chemotaxis protein